MAIFGDIAPLSLRANWGRRLADKFPKRSWCNSRSRSLVMIKFGVGQPVTRLEDARLLTGHGRYQDDTNLPGQLHAMFLRSPHAHARIRAIDTAAAGTAPGVRAVYTGADY